MSKEQEYQQILLPQETNVIQNPLLNLPSYTPLNEIEQQKQLYQVKINTQQHIERQSKNKQQKEYLLKIMLFVEEREIQISQPITIQNGCIMSYKMYRIKSKKKYLHLFDTNVQRRFSDFQYLHHQLIENYGGWLIPKLPEKQILASFDMETQSSRKKRKEKLKKYIDKILMHKKLRICQQFICFLFDFDQSFSIKKGQYISKKSIQDKIINIKNCIIQNSYKLISNYIDKNRSYLTNLKIYDNKLKIYSQQDRQIFNLQIVVNKLIFIIKQIKIVVINTFQQAECYENINDICKQLLQDDYTDEFCQQLKNNQNKNFSVNQKQNHQQFSNNDSLTRQTQIQKQLIKLSPSKYSQLIQSYENLLEYVETCKEAINRRTQLSIQLQSLKQQQSVYEIKCKDSPRNANFDILRNKIQCIRNKYQNVTKELREELLTHVCLSKAMINQFVKELQRAKSQFFYLNL